MAPALRHLYHVTVTCLLIFLTFSDANAEGRDIPTWNEAPAKSHPYIDAFFQVHRVAQQQEIFRSLSFQEKLKKASQALSRLVPPRSYASLSEYELPEKSLSTGDSDDTAEVQRILTSALEAMAADSAPRSACANDTERLLLGIFKRESWALKFLDAFGKPDPGMLNRYRFNLVGDYSLCRESSANVTNKFSGNYCILKTSFGPAAAEGLLDLKLGACVPDTCSDKELTLFVAEVLQILGLNGTLQAEAAECHTDKREMTTATIVAMTVVIIIGLLMVLGTAFDIIFIQWPKWQLASAREESLLTNGFQPEVHTYTAIGEDNHSSSDESSPLLGNPKLMSKGTSNIGVCGKVLVAFSVYTNGSKVLNTSQPPGSLGAIHGIRFLSMSWVLLGHVFVFGLGDVGNLASEFPVLLKRWTFDAIANAFVSVDTFFTLSGLLTAYVALGEMKRRGWKINWPLFYFHRFWRLTPPYMLTLLIVLGFQQYLGSGALWSPVQPGDKENCENYWWANLLYINNLVDAEKMCFGHSWYLSNDMQFFVLSPLMLIPFYFHAYIGLGVCMGFLLVCWITTGALSTHYKWPATLISNPVNGGTSDLNIISWFRDYYITPWCRIGAYIVGILAGYYLTVNNGRKKMKWYAVWLGWIIATATGLACVYGLRGDISGDNLNSVGVAAFYNAVARSAWGACVCWVIIACSSGHGGFVNSILSWSPFVVLGRLTYMCYLIHPCILYVYFQNQERLYYITDTTLVVTYCGLVVITNMVAFVLMLAFESPMISLEKAFIRKEQKD